jgi:drug/metabolite transporter (DMT)-like permease
MSTTPLQKPDVTGIALGIIGAALFSAKPIIIKFVYLYDVPPAVLMSLRMGFSLPFYMVFAILAFRQRRRENTPTDYSASTLITTSLLGICAYYLASYLDLEGLTRITAQFERLILFTYPLFVAILSALFLGIKFTRSVAISLGLTYAGIAIIFTRDLQGFGNDVAIGALMVFAAAAAFSVYVVFSKAMITNLGSRLFTCFAMIAASAVILVHFLVFYDFSQLQLPLKVYGLILLIAVFATVLPTFFISESIARIGPGPASILGSAGPVFTIIMAILVLGEEFTTMHFIGTALIISGIAWLAFTGKNPPKTV